MSGLFEFLLFTEEFGSLFFLLIYIKTFLPTVSHILGFRSIFASKLHDTLIGIFFFGSFIPLFRYY